MYNSTILSLHRVYNIIPHFYDHILEDRLWRRLLLCHSFSSFASSNNAPAANARINERGALRQLPISLSASWLVGSSVDRNF